VETGYGTGTRVSSHYDPMLAKVIAHGADRAEAVARLAGALERFRIEGVKTNIPYVLRVLRDPAFTSGQLHTQLGAAIASRPL
jgi:acetyl-CoA carboxylase biotin carboxylase subunit